MNEDCRKEKKSNARIEMSVGLGGLFQGLGALIQAATAMTNAAASDRGAGHTGSTVIGSSVRVAPRRHMPGGPRPVVVNGQARKRASVADAREPIVDILDEGDFLLVVAEVPGLEDGAVRSSIPADELLIVHGQSGDRKYYREISLPAAIDPTSAVSTCCNGVLELKLWKRQTG